MWYRYSNLIWSDDHNNVVLKKISQQDIKANELAWDIIHPNSWLTTSTTIGTFRNSLFFKTSSGGPFRNTPSMQGPWMPEPKIQIFLSASVHMIIDQHAKHKPHQTELNDLIPFWWCEYVPLTHCTIFSVVLSSHSDRLDIIWNGRGIHLPLTNPLREDWLLF